jgi:hypothetical protein
MNDERKRTPIITKINAYMMYTHSLRRFVIDWYRCLHSSEQTVSVPVEGMAFPQIWQCMC